MIKVVEGDILQASEDVVGHQVNCQGVMGAGLAKQIRDKYPDVYNIYAKNCYKTHPMNLMGDILVIQIEGKYVANIFSQLNYGRKKGVRYTDYVALHTGLMHLREYAESRGLTVALPYNIGCGLAGGDWDKVYTIIDRAFKDYDVTLYKFGG
ncbi:TPA: macro domain-containing protein [Bacillus cereus]